MLSWQPGILHDYENVLWCRVSVVCWWREKEEEGRNGRLSAQRRSSRASWWGDTTWERETGTIFSPYLFLLPLPPPQDSLCSTGLREHPLLSSLNHSSTQLYQHTNNTPSPSPSATISKFYGLHWWVVDKCTSSCEVNRFWRVAFSWDWGLGVVWQHTALLKSFQPGWLIWFQPGWNDFSSAVSCQTTPNPQSQNQE